MSARLARERARSVVATPQQKLRDARRALKAAATLIRDAASMGCMSDETRSLLSGTWELVGFEASALSTRIIETNQHQSSLRARRSRKAA